MLHGRTLSDSRFQLDALDGLRGLAVLLVFLSHTSNGGVFLLPFANFAGVGKSGVMLFFVLSAFLLTYPFVTRGRDALDRRFLLNYFLRRFLRIYPLYVVYLLLALVTTFGLWRLTGASKPVGLPFTLSGQGFVDHLTLQEGLGVTWSIVVEFRYYFVLPIVALVYSLILGNRLWPCAIFTLALILVCAGLWPQSESLINDSRLGPYLPVFLSGSFLAVAHHHWRTSVTPANGRAHFLLELCGLAALSALVLLIPAVARFVSGTEIPWDFFRTQFLLYGVLWAIVVFAASNARGLLRRLFEVQPLRYLGFISFSMYLWHILVPRALKALSTGTILDGWVWLAATIVISHVSWLLIEKPTSRIRLRSSAPVNPTEALRPSVP